MQQRRIKEGGRLHIGMPTRIVAHSFRDEVWIAMEAAVGHVPLQKRILEFEVILIEL
ncbi:hypothetical protein D9M69_410560 [compost metagenome]